MRKRADQTQSPTPVPDASSGAPDGSESTIPTTDGEGAGVAGETVAKGRRRRVAPTAQPPRGGWTDGRIINIIGIGTPERVERLKVAARVAEERGESSLFDTLSFGISSLEHEEVRLGVREPDPAPKVAKVQMLRIDRIVRDTHVQNRDEVLRDETVKHYAEAMEEAEANLRKFPKPVVFFDGTTYVLADGFHRLEAARRRGKRKIKCRVHEGSAWDAFQHGLTANIAHDTRGLRRSNADKHRAVENCLYWLRERGEDWSNRKIADVCGVHHDTVGEIRGQLAEAVRVAESATPERPSDPELDEPVNDTTSTAPDRPSAKKPAASAPEPDWQPVVFLKTLDVHLASQSGTWLVREGSYVGLIAAIRDRLATWEREDEKHGRTEGMSDKMLSAKYRRYGIAFHGWRRGPRFDPDPDPCEW